MRNVVEILDASVSSGSIVIAFISSPPHRHTLDVLREYLEYLPEKAFENVIVLTLRDKRPQHDSRGALCTALKPDPFPQSACARIKSTQAKIQIRLGESPYIYMYRPSFTYAYACVLLEYTYEMKK